MEINELPKVVQNPQFFYALCETELWLQSRAPFADLIFQVLRGQVIYEFCVKSSSGYSLVHLLPTSSSKSAPGPRGFLPVLREIELWLQSRAPFADFLCEIELSLQSCSLFCRQLSPIEPRNCGNRDSATTEATLPEKHRVSRPRVFSSLHSRVPHLSHFPTTS